MIRILDIAAKGLSVAAAALLFATFIAAGVGTWLQERRRGYRLPYEQPSHVRLIREDEWQ